MAKDDKQITKGNPVKQLCDCCGKFKPCHMYITMVGGVWVCQSCRTGKKEE